MKEILQARLTAAGWAVEPPAGAATFRIARRADAHLVLDERHGRDWWLWILAPAARDARAFGLPLTDANVEACAQVLLAEQDGLSTSSYFGAYGELQKVCEVSIMAWEQFSDAVPPFPDTPSGGGSSGGGDWGANPGKKGWS